MPFLKLNHIDLRTWLFGISLYVCLTGLFSSHFLFLWLILYVVTSRDRFCFTLDANLRILLIICILSTINQTVHIGYVQTDFDIQYILPYSFLILFTFCVSKLLPRNIFYVFVLCCIIDILTGCCQRFLGVKTFYDLSWLEEVEIGTSDVLYNLKVFGLNTNSSGFAFKIFLSILCFKWFNFSEFINKYLFWTLAIIGLLISFNRTIIVASAIFIFMISDKWTRIIIISAISASFVYFADDILMQLFRGQSSLTTGNALSERDIVYGYYYDFIKDNLFFGNGSMKLLIDMGGGRELHAHNSYLQTFANNGIIIFTLYMILIFRNMNRRNYKYILPILVASILQTVIFWGVSIGDIMLYKMLTDKETY